MYDYECYLQTSTGAIIGFIAPEHANQHLDSGVHAH